MAIEPASAPTPPAGLPLTGERTLPGIPDEAYWFARHVVAYDLAAARAGDRVVLDAGCGEGYGLDLLARGGARRVVGVDLDPAAAEHARATYGPCHPGVIEVVTCELMALPLPDASVDLTVSFQVIEHLYDIPGYLASLRRVTRPGGTLLLSTPNRLTFTPGSDTPVNPFHTREFSPDELRVELEAAGLEVPLMLGVHHGRRLRWTERLVRGPLTTRLSATPPDEWPGWLRRVVHATGPQDFRLRRGDLDRSLDLIAVCRRPPDG